MNSPLDTMDVIGHFSLKLVEIIGLLFLLVSAAINYWFDTCEIISKRKRDKRRKK